MFLFFILFFISFNALNLRRDLSILYNRIAILANLYCVFLAFFFLYKYTLILALLGGLFSISSITQIFQIFIYIICAFILLLTSSLPRKISFFISRSYIWISRHFFILDRMNESSTILNKMAEQFLIIEYPLIILFVIAGASFLISTRDLVSIFLSIELQSYGLYILSTVYRNSELSTTGGLIYFLLGGLSSSFILLGSSLLYANSGTTSLEGLYLINSISNSDDAAETTDLASSWYKSYYIYFSLLIFSIGFLFKVSAAPFHFWSPDIYDAIPTIVTTFVAIIAKISILAFFVELVYYTGSSIYSWIFGLLLSSFFSLIFGTVGGLTQFRIKRLLAYSTISHVGFILLALSICNIESIQTFIFYLIQYTLSNLNVFFIVITIGLSFFYSYTNNKKEDLELLDKNNSPLQLTSQLRGYFCLNPFLALSLAITIFSFGGLPPLVGFFAKQMVMGVAVNNGYTFLAFLAILTSVLGAVYYLNVIKEVYFFEYEGGLFFSQDQNKARGNLGGWRILTILRRILVILISCLFVLIGVTSGFFYLLFLFIEVIVNKLLNLDGLTFFFFALMVSEPCFTLFRDIVHGDFSPYVICTGFYVCDALKLWIFTYGWVFIEPIIPNVVIASFTAIIISNITLGILFFLFFNKEWLSMATIIVQSL